MEPLRPAGAEVERERIDPCFAFDGFVPGDDEVHASTCAHMVSA